MNRAFNFNAGPSALPIEVLEKAQEELLDFKGSGMSVMELSHRSKEYDAVHNEAEQLLRELMQIPDNYDVLFLQGGASTQFTMIPMNFLAENQTADYILTGSWSEKALQEAEKLGKANIAASTKNNGYNAIPSLDELSLSNDSAYVHITSNNTIYGTQWEELPSLKNKDLIADMSSDILSRPIDVSKFAMIYAGAQKNLGPSGVTVVILRNDMTKRIPNNIPTMLDYRTQIKKKSLYNTPPTFGIYMLSLVLNWMKEQGGVEQIAERNDQKSELIYNAIDESNGFYKPHAKDGSRSKMNVTFTLPSDDLTQKFLNGAKEKGFVGLNGHRSIGGCRASIYNAVPLESCQALHDYMTTFCKEFS
ncbi:3-phosphoserine/phosphohydroxythreonine transaminase [Bacillus solimangrovi]|uniref:Phosphoserine aminotransferase n=1 Tax=Bacillus solimangrovi TaxID=1305675 RepID=A0A1E5LCA5_9BACI|nr:3-phosphoserine/phosphohydroxythreonine transaminase [Bacillus solimangrovi]OEH91720.1 phosphoserine transaminase [Bacillus solimangrovi]